MKIDKQKILILLGFIAAAIVLILLVSELNFPVVKDPQESCIRENLTWIEGANECEFMNQSACESLSGKFNECGK